MIQERSPGWICNARGAFTGVWTKFVSPPFHSTLDPHLSGIPQAQEQGISFIVPRLRLRIFILDTVHARNLLLGSRT